MMVVIRYISKVLVWILTVLVIIGSIGNSQTQYACLMTLSTSRNSLSAMWCWFKTRRVRQGELWTCFSSDPSSGGTAVLWWLYVDHRKALDNNTLSVFGKEVASDNVKALLVYAIIGTVFTVWLIAQVLDVLLFKYFLYLKSYRAHEHRHYYTLVQTGQVVPLFSLTTVFPFLGKLSAIDSKFNPVARLNGFRGSQMLVWPCRWFSWL